MKDNPVIVHKDVVIYINTGIYSPINRRSSNTTSVVDTIRLNTTARRLSVAQLVISCYVHQDEIILYYYI